MPLVHKVELLYDDRPEEVSIRVEMVNNVSSHSNLAAESTDELQRIVDQVRIHNCDKIILTYVSRDVII